MQNVLLRVTHYERGAERIVSARPVILYIAKRREDEKRERGLHSTSSWSAKMPKAGAGFFPITSSSTVGKEFFLLGDEGRVVSSAEERGGDLERRVPQHEDGWIPPRGMCFLHTHARPVFPP